MGDHDQYIDKLCTQGKYKQLCKFIKPLSLQQRHVCLRYAFIVGVIHNDTFRMRKLMEMKVDVNQDTFLRHAIDHERVDALDFLIRQKINLDQTFTRPQTIFLGNITIIQMLLEAKADPMQKSDRLFGGLSPLEICIKYQFPKITELLKQYIP